MFQPGGSCVVLITFMAHSVGEVGEACPEIRVGWVRTSMRRGDAAKLT